MDTVQIQCLLLSKTQLMHLSTLQSLLDVSFIRDLMLESIYLLNSYTCFSLALFRAYSSCSEHEGALWLSSAVFDFLVGGPSLTSESIKPRRWALSCWFKFLNLPTNFLFQEAYTNRKYMRIEYFYSFTYVITTKNS